MMKRLLLTVSTLLVLISAQAQELKEPGSAIQIGGAFPQVAVVAGHENRSEAGIGDPESIRPGEVAYVPLAERRANLRPRMEHGMDADSGRTDRTVPDGSARHLL